MSLNKYISNLIDNGDQRTNKEILGPYLCAGLAWQHNDPLDDGTPLPRFLWQLLQMHGVYEDVVYHDLPHSQAFESDKFMALGTFFFFFTFLHHPSLTTSQRGSFSTTIPAITQARPRRCGG